MDGLKYKTIYWGIITLLLYTCSFFLFDRIIDIYVHNSLTTEKWLNLIAHILSAAAADKPYILGIFIMLISILIFDIKLKSKWSKYFLIISASLVISILVGGTLKVILARYRPEMLFEHNLYGFHFFSTKGAFNSTPSGHTFRIFALITSICLLNRKLSSLFVIAILVGLSRIILTAHYPSDIIFGAYIGIFSALWSYKILAGKLNLI